MEREVVMTGVRTSPTTGKQLQFIRVTEREKKFGVYVNQRRGFIEIDPAEAQDALKAINEGKIQLAFGNYNRQTDLYTIQAVVLDEGSHAAAAGTTASADATLEHK